MLLIVKIYKNLHLPEQSRVQKGNHLNEHLYTISQDLLLKDRSRMSGDMSSKSISDDSFKNKKMKYCYRKPKEFN